MKILLVLCIIGLAGAAFAKPGVIRERMSREFRSIKSGAGFKPPLNPLHVFRNQLSKPTKTALQRKTMGCDLCPPPSDMKPCACECECKTTKCLANIKCGSALQTPEELQRVLSLSSYPVRNYSSLLVENTIVDGGIYKELLGSTISFQEVNFNHNGFVSVERGAFENTGPMLRKLILNNNEILFIEDRILEESPNIEYIDISNNKLIFIPKDSMQSKHLRFLNISNNDLEDIGDSAFRDLTKLAHLDLSNNSLTKLSTNMLAFVNHEDVLLWVNLSYNHIASVESHVISGIKKIILDIRYNQLEMLNEEIFRNVIDSTDASIHIDVTGNPILCDCFLLWVVQNSTVANCFDDFPVCDSTIRNVTTANLGDCGQNKTLLS